MYVSTVQNTSLLRPPPIVVIGNELGPAGVATRFRLADHLVVRADLDVAEARCCYVRRLAGDALDCASGCPTSTRTPYTYTEIRMYCNGVIDETDRASSSSIRHDIITDLRSSANGPAERSSEPAPPPLLSLAAPELAILVAWGRRQRRYRGPVSNAGSRRWIWSSVLDPALTISVAVLYTAPRPVPEAPFLRMYRGPNLLGTTHFPKVVF